MKRSFLSLAVAAVVLSGCSLIPDYQRPEAPVAAAYPQEVGGQAVLGRQSVITTPWLT
ncbi:lipoprotein, partial [Pseudomonas aeruginosa]|uniref:lipoprotein n=1 Tax=Pseudomonas aeruginosa TaxID=287 RepID=UPI003014BB9A